VPRARIGSAIVIAVVIAVVSASLASGARRTGATLTDQAGSTVDVATDTLPPPTNLAATGGTTVGLTWTPSVNAATTGYEVWRGTTSGGAYALVGSVTPGSAASGSDAPAGPGTYWYVLRSVFQNWRSVDSNEASATIVLAPVGTGFTTCAAASSAADTGGDNNGYETSTANACADDDLVATDASTGTAARSTSCANPANDRHRFRDFGIGLPPSVSAIDGITVRAEAGMNNNGGTSVLCVELSWDGGASWTAAQAQTLTSSALTIYPFGGPTDTWGRSWTVGQLANASFRVRLTDATSHPTKDYRLDHVAVEVTYTP
jgi:hypothetical protein